MISSKDYKERVEEYFGFLIEQFEFELTEEKLKGSVYYDVRYQKGNKVISISYENVEDYLLVIIFILSDGQLPDYDDKKKTLHLEKLRAKIFPALDKEAIRTNDEFFRKFLAKSEIEKKLLKSAKDLRLCLFHLDQIPIE